MLSDFNTILSFSLVDYKPVYWHGQPVYITYPKLKSYLSIHLGEDFASLFAQPRVSEKSSSGSVSGITWVTDKISALSVPLTDMSEDNRLRILAEARDKISGLIGFSEHLKESSNPEDVSWGELIEKACYIPDESHIFVEGDKFVFAGWGFSLATGVGTGVFSTDFDRRQEYKSRFKAPAVPVSDSKDEPAETLPLLSEPPDSFEFDLAPESTAEVSSSSNPETADNSSSFGESGARGGISSGSDGGNPEIRNGGGRNSGKTPAPPVWKRWLFWFFIIVFFLLFLLLWKKCSSLQPDDGRGLLPDNPGWVVPIDSATIISDPDSVTTIVSNRLNIAVTGGDLVQFARAFKEAYPDKSFSIIYYDTLTRRVQIQIPDSLRETLKEEIPQKIKGFDLLVWHESLFEGYKTPSDPAFLAADKSWFARGVRAGSAWDITFGKPDVIVAVIDDGFDLSHPEFAGKIYKPWNVIERTANVMTNTRSQHGSHVAGTAVANRDNGSGACGIAPDCKLMPIQVSDRYGNISNTAVIDAVLYAIYQGADVVNLSLGMDLKGLNRLPPGVQEDLIAYRFREEELFWAKIFKMADERNVTIVMAGGNDGVLVGIDPMQRSPLGIKVSAVDPGTNLAAFSNYGAASTVSAPGVRIFSCLPGRNYGYMDGTSMASPVVAGAVALIKSVKPDISNRDIIDLLRTTGAPIKSSGRKAGKLIQIDKALQKIQNTGNNDKSEGDCSTVKRKIDSLQREIDRLKRFCRNSSDPVDTMKIPQRDDLGLIAGRWKSTTDIHNNDGETVTLVFDFNQDGSGKLTLIEPSKSRCVSDISLSLKSSVLSIDQLDLARCAPPPGSYNAYEFTCKPDAGGYASCTARSKSVKANKFQFRLIKIK